MRGSIPTDRRSGRVRARALGRPEGHEQHEPFFDVMEPMRDLGGHEHHRPRDDRSIVLPDRDPGPTLDHVVQLVLGVRRLLIGRSGLEDIQPCRQIRHGQEFVVAASRGDAVGLQLIEFPSLHGGSVAARWKPLPPVPDIAATIVAMRDDPRRPPSRADVLVAAVAFVLAGVLAGCGPAGPTIAPSVSVAPSTMSTIRPATPSPTPSPTAASSSPQSTGSPTVDLELVADGLDAPLDIATRPEDGGSIFVVEQGGRVRLVRDGVLLAAPFLDIGGIVTAGGEQGLLGMAVHPDPADGRVFVYYTALDGRQVVAAYRTDPSDPDRVEPDSGRVLLRMDDPFPNHNGGALAFGPDGFLYVSTGDGGGAGDPLDSGRRLDTLLAKVLRLDVDDEDPGLPYAIPADNPFVDRPEARAEIWLTGLRNPWRMRFDPATGDLWMGDVGQSEREEIDRAPAGVGGLDFGWNIMEGAVCYEAETCDQDGLTLPVTDYGQDEGCAVTGGAVYRGTDQPALAGMYVFSDYCSGRIWVVDAGIEGRQEPIVVMDSGRTISAIAPGPDGELYATDLGTGELLRIIGRAG